MNDTRPDDREDINSMTMKSDQRMKAAIIAAGLWVLVTGMMMTTDVVVAGTMVCCLGLVSGRWSRFLFGRRRQSEEAPAPEPQAPSRDKSASVAVAEPKDMDEYVDLLLAQGRHVLLLRPQIANNLRRQQLDQAIQALREDMAPVPQGEVLLAQPDLEGKEDAGGNSRGHLITVEGFYLDRYPVTNRQYERFVDAGGYEDSALWDPAIWPGVVEFVDGTGQLGPRFWQDRSYAEPLADHPVVGVSWFEAQAYARWAGKRLPTDPEWVKAGCWPVSTVGAAPQQRKYPWGSTMDTEKANLWASGVGTTVPVFDCADGAGVGGVCQLVGNVWEWTAADYGVWHPGQHGIECQNPLKSLRGGAFDTYFDNHAVCQFQSGDNPLARKHNIGFRCSLGTCDVTSEASETAT